MSQRGLSGECRTQKSNFTFYNILHFPPFSQNLRFLASLTCFMLLLYLYHDAFALYVLDAPANWCIITHNYNYNNVTFVSKKGEKFPFQTVPVWKGNFSPYFETNFTFPYFSKIYTLSSF